MYFGLEGDDMDKHSLVLPFLMFAQTGARDHQSRNTPGQRVQTEASQVKCS